MRNVFLIALFALLSGCASRIEVDVSQSRLAGYTVGLPVFSARCATGRNGVGGRPGSGRTPLSGNLKIIGKYPHYRTNRGVYLGKVFRIGGTSRDGYRQDGRGILAHRRGDLSGTAGCLGLSPADMERLYGIGYVGMEVRIKR